MANPTSGFSRLVRPLPNERQAQTSINLPTKGLGNIHKKAWQRTRENWQIQVSKKTCQLGKFFFATRVSLKTTLTVWASSVLGDHQLVQVRKGGEVGSSVLTRPLRMAQAFYRRGHHRSIAILARLKQAELWECGGSWSAASSSRPPYSPNARYLLTVSPLWVSYASSNTAVACGIVWRRRDLPR